MSDKRKSKISLGELTIEADIFKAATNFSDSNLAEIHELLSIWGMTPLQYNALRVLYVEDHDDKGLPSKEVGKRLTTRVPDVTRLLDRMAEKGWLTRERDKFHKRIVRSRLTNIGIELVESANAPVLQLEQKQLSHLNDDEKKALSELLNKALNKPDNDSN